MSRDIPTQVAIDRTTDDPLAVELLVTPATGQPAPFEWSSKYRGPHTGSSRTPSHRRAPRTRPRPPAQARTSRLAARKTESWWQGWWFGQAVEWVNPHDVEVADTPVRHDIVEQYVKDPDRESEDGNDPCLSRFPDGVLVCLEGKHRTLAARIAHRALRARVADEPSS